MLASVVNRHHWASHQLHGESPHRWSLVPPPRTPVDRDCLATVVHRRRCLSPELLRRPFCGGAGTLWFGMVSSFDYSHASIGHLRRSPPTNPTQSTELTGRC
jgi:hypothetical protein